MRTCCAALANLSTYLVEKCNFSSAFPGVFVNDWIERRFGRYRQFHGGNYYVSVRQVFEAEKKIKVSTLLKYHDFKLKDMQVLDDTEKEEQEAQNLLSFPVSTLPDISCFCSEDRNIILYVSGYVSFSLSKSLKCSDCKNHINEEKILEIICDSDVFNESDLFLTELRNRGGLKYPSAFVFTQSSIAYYVFGLIKEDNFYVKNIYYSRHVSSSLSLLVIHCLLSSTMYCNSLEGEC